MSAGERLSRHASMLRRAFGMLLRPGGTLAAGAAERATVSELYLGYIAPLAAIGPVCGAIGLLVFGGGITGISLKLSVEGVVLRAALDYGLTLLAVYLLAQAISLMAPAFGGTASRIQALKLTAWSGTALWVSGLFAVYPTLGFVLAILGGMYSLYALYVGLPRLMRAPEDRSLTYFAAVLVTIVLLALLFRGAASAVR